MTKIYALVVTSGETPYLPATLQALAASELTPTRSVILDVSGSGVVDRPGFSTIRCPGAPNLGQAIAQAQNSDKFPALEPGDLLWILHDDSAPDPAALRQQCEMLENSQTITIVGTKQRSWDDKNVVLEVGISATGAGRRLIEVDEKELDQGQFDHREDVLAVGSAGMLVRWEVFCLLGGFDPHLGPFGDGLELCRRVRLAGYRVVVAPGAIVYHKQAGFWGLRGPDGGRPSRQNPARRLSDSGRLLPEARVSFTRRRASQLHNWLVAAPWWAWWALLPLWLLILTPARALGRLVTKEVRLAGGEIVAAAQVFTTPWRIYAARSRLRAHQKLPRRSLRPLQIKARQIRQARRTARKIAADRRRPAPLERVAAQNLRSDLAIERTLVVLICSLLACLTIYVWRNILGGVTYGALPGAHFSLSQFWQYWVSGWVPTGDGYGGEVGGLDLLGAVVGLWQALFALTQTDGLVWALLASPIAAFLAAFWALGSLTRRCLSRIPLALVWVLLPNFWISLAAGQLASLTVWVFLPLFAGSVARAAHINAPRVVQGQTGPELVHSRPLGISQVGIAALCLVILSAASPLLVVLATVAVLVLRWFEPSLRSRLWLALGPAWVATIPMFVQALTGFSHGSWRLLFTPLSTPSPLDPATMPGVQNTAGLLSVLGLPLALEKLSWQLSAGPWLPPWAGYVFVLPTVLLVIFALLALSRLDQRRRAVRFSWLIAGSGMALAVFSTTFSTQLYAARAYGPWPGVWIGVYLAGLEMAVACAFTAPTPIGDEATPSPQQARALKWWGQLGSSLAASAKILLVAAGVAAFVPWPFQNHTQPVEGPAASEQALIGSARTGAQPTVARTIADLPGRALALRVVPGPAGAALIETELWNAGPNSVFDITPSTKVRSYLQLRAQGGKITDPAQASLSKTVAALSTGNTPSLRSQLEQHAISHIVLYDTQTSLQSMNQTIENSLDTVRGLQRTAASATAAVWRVADGQMGLYRVGQATWKAGKPQWVENPAVAPQPVNMQNGRLEINRTNPGQVLILAQRAAGGFTARAGKEDLTALSDGPAWQQVFRLPEGHTHVQISYQNWWHGAWLASLGLSVAIALLAAIPLKRAPAVRS